MMPLKPTNGTEQSKTPESAASVQPMSHEYAADADGVRALQVEEVGIVDDGLHRDAESAGSEQEEERAHRQGVRLPRR